MSMTSLSFKVLSLILAIGIISVYNFLDDILRLLRVGSTFTAKTICAGQFISNRNVDDLRRFELKGLASALFTFHINFADNYVIAYPFHWIFHDWIASRSPYATSAKVFYHGEQLGCRIQSRNEIETSSPSRHKGQSFLRTGSGARRELIRRIDQQIQEFLDLQMSDAAFLQNHTRATVVISGGDIVGEAYQAKIGISKGMKLLGWSMTKSIQAVMLGSVIQQKIGELSLETVIDIFNRSSHPQVTVYDLLSMADVLPYFPEYYELTASVPHMLYDSQSYGDFARGYKHIGKPEDQRRRNDHIQHTNLVPKLEHNVSDKNKDSAIAQLDSGFEWYYSSGVSNILAQVIRSYFKSDEAYWRFPFESIFASIGADFTCELDPAGTFVASSFCYASAEDWAKVGQLLMNKGSWKGKTILSKEYVDVITTARLKSGGNYGGSLWLNPASVDVAEYNYLSHEYKDFKRSKWMTRALPSDAYMMSGYDGQYVVVIPSLECVISRLGMTKDTGDGQPEKPAPSFSKPLFFGTLARHCHRLMQSRSACNQGDSLAATQQCEAQ